METIWKFPLKTKEHQEIEAPPGARFMYVGLDPTGQACVWLAVNPYATAIRMKYIVAIVGTGAYVPEQDGRHLGSYVDGPYVWHVFGKFERL